MPTSENTLLEKSEADQQIEDINEQLTRIGSRNKVPFADFYSILFLQNEHAIWKWPLTELLNHHATPPFFYKNKQTHNTV